jgi:hypothetical protein
MKTLLNISLMFYLISFNLSGQQRKSVLIKTSNVGQIYNVSCWAASTQMLVNAYNPTLTNEQCRLISNAAGNSCEYICSDTIVLGKYYTTKLRASGDSIREENIFDLGATAKSLNLVINNVFPLEFIGLKGIVKMPASAYDTFNLAIKDTCKKYNFKISRMNHLSWETFKDNFGDPFRSPIYAYKRFSEDESHITVYCGYEHSKYNQKQMRWIYVKDPWPQNQKTEKGGTQYITTYEFYKKDESPTKVRLDPVKSLIYNLVYKNLAIPKYSEDNTANWNEKDTTYYNIVTNLDDNLYNSVATQADTLLAHLTNTASDTLLKYVGLQKTGATINQANILQLIQVNAIENTNTLQNQSNEYISFPNVFKNTLTLYDAIPTYLVPVVKNNTFLTVMAFEPTAKNQWYTTRVEKYQKSILELVREVVKNTSSPNSPQKLSDIKAVYLNRTYGSSNDFLIIEPKNNSEKILVDLFGTIDFLPNPDKVGKTGYYNYKVHKLNEPKLKDFHTYLSPKSPQNGSTDNLKITEGGKRLIQACQKLLARTDSTCFYGDGVNIVYCRNDTMPASCYNKGNSTYKGDSAHVTFLTTQYPYRLGNKYCFNIGWTKDWGSGTCQGCIPKKVYFPFNPETASNQVYELIFVPVSKYKGLRNNDHSLQGDNYHKQVKLLAIQPIDMAKIDTLFLESTDGYMNKHPKEKEHYDEIYSSKGVVCEVTLKTGEKIQCYVLNDYDGGSIEGSGTVRWKEKK